MNPCPGCNKFASLEMGDPEPELDVEYDGTVTGTVRVVLQSSCCGEEMKENTFEINMSPDEFPGLVEHIDEHKEKGEDCSLDVDGSAASSDKFQTHDKYGNPITNSRYQRHYYGYEMDVTITCVCGQEFTSTVDEYEQASSFEELV